MNIKRVFEIDAVVFFAVSLLILIGVLFIYSSGITTAGVNISNEYLKQSVWAIVSIAVVFALSVFNYKRLYDVSLYLYLLMLGVLIYTALFGKVVNGAKSWIGIGNLGVQPSEFAKIATILYLAKYLDQTRHSFDEFYRFAIACGITFVPVALILLQPDLGTALVFFPILLVMTFCAGSPAKYIFFLLFLVFGTAVLTVLPIWIELNSFALTQAMKLITDVRYVGFLFLILGLVAALAIIGHRQSRKSYFFWIAYVALAAVMVLVAQFLARKILKEYQIMRLIVFLNPNIDPRGSGWNIIQSITAIGSGGLFGKGFLNGTQSHYHFLPQQSTDFIFSILSEELGFLGGFFVFSLYLVILLRMVSLMKNATDNFGILIVSGVASFFIFHFVVNAGMAMGIMPITGIPLLFLSYGGSSLLAAMVGIGLVMSIHVRRFER